MRKLFLIAATFAVLACAVPALAQNECAAVNPAYQPLQQTRDANNVVHQISCQDPATGKVYCTAWAVSCNGGFAGTCTVSPVAGSTTAGIQEAINACAAGQSVFVPCGTYVPTTGIVINVPIAVVGAQRSCVIIKPAPNPSFDVITITSSNVAVANLTVDGNATGESAFSSIVLSTGTNSVSGITFDKVIAQNAGNYCIGWNLSSGGAVSNITITNSILNGCAKREFYANWAASVLPSSGYFFSNNTFGATTAPANNPNPTGFWGAVNFTVSSAAAVSNINLLNNSILFPVLVSPTQESDGVVISTGGAAGATIAGITISGNNIQGPPAVAPLSGHGVELWGASQATILGNFFGPAFNQFFIQQGASGTACNATVTGNTLLNTASTTVTGIVFSPNCQGTVQGNFIDMSGSEGIELDGGGQLASGNTIKAEATGTINLRVKCQEAGGCLSSGVVGNVFRGFSSGQTRLMITDGSTAFKNLSVASNTFDTAGTGISFSSTLDSAFLSGNIFTGVTNPYVLMPSGWRDISSTTIVGSCTGVATASQTLGLFGTGPNVAATTCTSTTIGSGIPQNYSGTLGYLKVTATAGGVNASSGQVTVLKNGGATGLTCLIGTSTSCENRTAVTFVAGDLISINFTTQAAETLAGVNATIMQIN